MVQRTSYHHGDLPTALVAAGLALIAERGIAALSVAEVARRTGVSAAAPYRHFPTRQALLQATAIRAAELLAGELTVALSRFGAADEPVEALAVTAEVYVRFVARHHAGFDLIFADQLHGTDDPALSAAGRAVIDIFLPIAVDITGDVEAALALLEKHIAAAHGYAVLHLSGFTHRRTLDDLATGAADVTRTLARAAQL